MRLLVVEDDPLIARSLDNALAPLGNIVEVFTHCAEASAALCQGGFDLVLLDLGLPDGNGLTLLEALRERGDMTPVLILTARDGVEDRVRGLDLAPMIIWPSPSRSPNWRHEYARCSGAVSSAATTCCAWGPCVSIRSPDA